MFEKTGAQAVTAPGTHVSWNDVNQPRAMCGRPAASICQALGRPSGPVAGSSAWPQGRLGLRWPLGSSPSACRADSKSALVYPVERASSQCGGAVTGPKAFLRAVLTRNLSGREEENMTG